MEALIPKLFILTAEASIVLLLILIIMIIFNIKAKRKDMKAVNELVSDYTNSKEERIAALKKQITAIGFKGNSEEQAEKLFQNEKNLIKEFVTLYLRHDIYRLLDYPENIIENNDVFLKINGSGQAATVTAAPESPEIESPEAETTGSEETANATILAREQAESNDAHLKELSELRLKNTELNEHLFEALETITSLMTEHGRKTGQEVESNAQKVLDAIIYLRDQRLENNNDPSTLAPPANDSHDKIDSFNLDAIKNSDNSPVSVDLDNNDATLDDSTAVNLGINDELNMDLDTLDEDENSKDSAAVNLEEAQQSEGKQETDIPETTEPANDEEDDPWADALAEQASSEAEIETQSTGQSEEEEDPWADALAEQTSSEAETETQPTGQSEEEEDPWADALAEQASSEAETETQSTGQPEEEKDPWADALAEQASSETETETQSTEQPEEDPWADALAEQASSEAETETQSTEQPEEEDPWADALAEQEKSEKK